ncbi:aspartyl protease family protein [Hufsiella ginkgonis]|uniref:Peptide-binding protein n=1 Tax=Hufsiella ginkgonis TaxID=2695274 RepID=A0A7K1XTH9_9SPHI|nr:aspartyl protease family protein [Hufsiella ginkgonis]MXV14240.1 peptide-binding protein [Hufsiella ginkgonis]
MLVTSFATGQGLHLEYKRRRQTIEFKMVKNLMIIPIMINGKGPFNFALDTGVGLFIITDSTLIDSLAIHTLRQIKITGFGEGKDISAYVTPSVTLHIGTGISGNVSAAILKHDAFDLSTYTGMPVHGLIGYEFFNSFIVRIDYQVKTITAYSTEKPYRLRRGATVPITIEEHKPYLQSEVTLFSGRTLLTKLIIDTGAGHPISLETDLGNPFEVPKPNIAGNLGVGLNGPIKGNIARIGSFRLGNYELKNVIAAFPDFNDVGAKVGGVNRNGNLGNTILKRFNVVFDYSRGLMYIRPSYEFKEAFEHDMSGLELNAAGKDLDRIIISRVEPGSAGDDAGLKKDDEILAINFKPVNTMSLQEIDDLFRSRNNKNLLLDIMPKDAEQREHVVLTLKRRI